MDENKTVTKVPSISLNMTKTKAVSKQLMKFVQENNLSVKIAGKDYLMVEGWQFAGSQLNLHAVIKECEAIPDPAGKETKYKAVAEVYSMKTGQLMSSGFAWCSDKEGKKKTFEEYAVASMAQTRAIGKAYRNILAWLVKAAGFETTPSDEITGTVKEDLVQTLADKKAEVFNKFKEKEMDTEAMVEYINEATGKNTLDTVDDADKVLNKMKEDDEA